MRPVGQLCSTWHWLHSLLMTSEYTKQTRGHISTPLAGKTHFIRPNSVEAFSIFMRTSEITDIDRQSLTLLPNRGASRGVYMISVMSCPHVSSTCSSRSTMAAALLPFMTQSWWPAQTVAKARRSFTALPITLMLSHRASVLPVH